VASYSSGRSPNEAAYLLQLLRGAWAPTTWRLLRPLHAPSTVGLGEVFGLGHFDGEPGEPAMQFYCVVLVGSTRGQPPAADGMS